eukprot:5437465-Pyramimonas_sp.AAC.1
MRPAFLGRLAAAPAALRLSSCASRRVIRSAFGDSLAAAPAAPRPISWSSGCGAGSTPRIAGLTCLGALWRR